MDLLIAIVVGGVIGWIASLLVKTRAPMGLLGCVVVGVVGSALGHWLAPQLGIVETAGVARWLVAIGGAALLIVVLKVLGVLR